MRNKGKCAFCGKPADGAAVAVKISDTRRISWAFGGGKLLSVSYRNKKGKACPSCFPDGFGKKGRAL